MKIPINPPKEVPMKNYREFSSAAKNQVVFTEPVVVSVETSQQFADLVKRLGSQVRPFAVAVLAPK